MFRYLPEQGSTFAPSVDFVHHLITDISVFFTVAIVGTMLYFAVRYRRRGKVDHETPQIEGSKTLEVLWTVIPLLICILVAGLGLASFREMRTVPKDALEISVWGKQWAWTFVYPNGKRSANEFVVPVNKPVKLLLHSEDVLHSFFVPGMRTKMDAVPGQITYQWFQPVKTGRYQAYCTEYCGRQHSAMLAVMNVVSPGEFDRWVADTGGSQRPSDLGRTLFVEQACNSCHSLDGTQVVGPSFLNLVGRKGELADGSQYTVDENYIRESILHPNAKVVKGYGPPSPMPAFEGKLTEEDITNLIAYIKTINVAPPAPKKAAVDTSSLSPADRGKLLYQQKACLGCHSLDGSQVVGPTWKGLYGKQGTLADGTAYTADDAYLKEAILKPQAHVVKGFGPPSSMPPYEGQLSEADVNDIIEFIKTVK